MSLATGSRLGPYEVLSLIGAGGMGEVYKARDPRLDRMVALKVLSAHLADRPEVRERFEREARTIANLKHPNICVLYDIGKDGGRDFLVLEYLEGETLAQRLAKGPLPLDQVLRYAIEISDALDKAHRNGVTHRDIKPGNIMLIKDGTKLLDFGLAKLKQEVAPPIPRSELPTGMGAPTAQGTILGTLQYMAPEQVEGKVDELDGRTDIFAFGAVIYEMATGKKAFEGKTQASVIAAILERDPPPMSSLQPMTPPALDRTVKRCLPKEPEKRWQAASDLRDELKWIAETGSQAGIPLPLLARRKTRERLGWVAAAVLLVIAVVALVLPHFRQPTTEASKPSRFFVYPPEKVVFSPSPNFVTVSPDGTRLAFVATDSSGKTQLWVRPLDSLFAQPLPGTEGANQPFWSADSRSIAFYAGSKLKRIDVSGGPAQNLCDTEAGGAGSWNREGVVLFTRSQAGVPIYRVASMGGKPAPATTLDPSRQENGHLWPHFLPDGTHFLYYAQSSNAENDAIYLGLLDSQERKLILKARSNIFYASGHLLFVRDRTLMAQLFDANRFETIGEPFPVAEEVQYNPANGRAAFFVSQTGVLAYRSSGYRNNLLVWVDRGGKEVGTMSDAGRFLNPTLSPDGKYLAVQRSIGSGGGDDVWLFDLIRGINSRFTFDPGNDVLPLWSPDGSRILFVSDRNGAGDLYQKNSKGVGNEELLLKLDGSTMPEDWSSDGRFLIYSTLEKRPRDLWALPLSGERKPFPLIESPFSERHAQLSPDGRWLAYTSDESGSYEVYVQSFPPGSGKWQVSKSGGVQPRWRRDGKELFYLSLDQKLMAAPLRAGATFEAGSPTVLFGNTRLYLFPATSSGQRQQYDVAADGQRFLLNLSQASSDPLTIVLNWTAGVKK